MPKGHNHDLKPPPHTASKREMDAHSSPSLQQQAEARFMRKPLSRTPRAANDTPTKRDPTKREAFMQLTDTKYDTKLSRKSPRKVQKAEDEGKGTSSKHAQRDAFLKQMEDEAPGKSQQYASVWTKSPQAAQAARPSIQQQAEARFMRKPIASRPQRAGVSDAATVLRLR